MRAGFPDPAGLQDPDPVGVPDGRQAVRHDQRSAVAGGDQQGALDGRLRLVVHGAGRLVQDQHGGIAQQRPGECEALPLPAGQVHPALADDGAEPVGVLLDEFGGRSSLGGLPDLLVGGIRPAVGDVLGDRPREQEHVLRDIAHRAAQRVPVEVAHVPAVEQHLARPRVVEPQDEPQQRGLARPGGAHDRMRLPGGDDQVHPAQDVGALAVAGTHPDHLDAAAHRLRQGLVPRGDGQRRLDEGEDARGRRPAALIEVEHMGDVGQRPQQPLGHEDQHRVQAELQLAVERHPAAQQQRAGEAGQDRHADQRHERRRGADRVDVGLPVGRRHRGHPVPLPILGVERLDGRDPGQIRRQDRRQLGHRRPDVEVQRLQPALEEQGSSDDQRDRQERQQQQLPGCHREHRPDEEHVQGRLQDRRRTHVEEALQLVDVVVQGRQRRALRPGLVPVDVQMLDTVVRLDAQVVLDALRNPPPQQRGGVLRGRLDDPQHDVDDGQPAQLRIAGLDAEHGRDERVLAVDDDVDGCPDEQFGDDVGDLVDRRHGHREHDPRPVLLLAVPQGAQRGLVGDVIHAILGQSPQRRGGSARRPSHNGSTDSGQDPSSCGAGRLATAQVAASADPACAVMSDTSPRGAAVPTSSRRTHDRPGYPGSGSTLLLGSGC